MLKKTYRLTAWVDAKTPDAIRGALEDVASRVSIFSTDLGFFVKATMRGVGARELNRTFFAIMRRVEPKATVRAEWRSGTTTEWFFDNVRKGLLKSCKSSNARNHHRGSPRLTSKVPSAMM